MLGALIIYLKKTNRKKLFTERTYDQKGFNETVRNNEAPSIPR